MTKQLLWVADEVPDPDLGGGSIRQYNLLRRLADEAEVDLVLVGKLRDKELRQSLRGITELPRPPVPAAWRVWLANRQPVIPRRPPVEVQRARPLVDLVKANLGELSAYDVVLVEHEWLAPLLPRRRSGSWVITLQNLLSLRSRQLAEVADKRRVQWLLRRDADHAQLFEQRIVTSYDLTIVPSREDAMALGGRAAVIPNGIDLDRFTPSELPDGPRLLFSASFNWEPNIDGARWFCERVFPRIQAQLPSAVLLLVGREPDGRIRDLINLPGVEAHFDVPAMLPYLQSARVSVVPLRIGSGTRVKGLEAMAAGRPIAGTTVGLEGLGLRDRVSAVIADSPVALAEGIVQLCRDNVQARRLAEAARRLAESYFGWDRIASDYIERVLSLPGTPTSSPATEASP